MPFSCKQYVTIVPILDLEKVAHHGVSCKTFNKISACATVGTETNWTKMIIVKISKGCKRDIIAFEGVKRNGIRNGLHDTTLAADGKYFIWIKPDWYIFLGQYHGHTVYQLRSELFLSKIIVALDQDGYQLPVRMVPMGTFRTQPGHFLRHFFFENNRRFFCRGRDRWKINAGEGGDRLKHCTIFFGFIFPFPGRRCYTIVGSPLAHGCCLFFL
mmetsp:Transcript_37381/g.87172  ORF Transcript_37381/g.87172 Transcript_37381/m.87172 type:complete len:214 (-) Transcript_37381:1483-2124(-)